MKKAKIGGSSAPHAAGAGQTTRKPTTALPSTMYGSMCTVFPSRCDRIVASHSATTHPRVPRKHGASARRKLLPPAWDYRRQAGSWRRPRRSSSYSRRRLASAPHDAQGEGRRLVDEEEEGPPVRCRQAPSRRPPPRSHCGRWSISAARRTRRRPRVRPPPGRPCGSSTRAGDDPVHVRALVTLPVDDPRRRAPCGARAHSGTDCWSPYRHPPRSGALPPRAYRTPGPSDLVPAFLPAPTGR